MFGFISDNMRIILKIVQKKILFFLLLAFFLCLIAFFFVYLFGLPSMFKKNEYVASELAVDLKSQIKPQEPLVKRGTELRINLDGKFVQISDPILSVENRTYLPLRALGDLIGAKTYYDDINKISAQNLNNTLVETFSGSPYIIVDKKNKLWVDEDNHDQRAFIWYWNSRLYLPLRQVCEVLGLKVDWDEKNNVICLTSKGKSPEAISDISLTVDELIQRMKNIADHDRQQEANLSAGLGREGEPCPDKPGIRDMQLSPGGDWKWRSNSRRWEPC